MLNSAKQKARLSLGRKKEAQRPRLDCAKRATLKMRQKAAFSVDAPVAYLKKHPNLCTVVRLAFEQEPWFSRISARP